MAGATESPNRRKRGFETAGGLLQGSIRAVGEKRGFAVARLLTQWAEVVGADWAEKTRPVRIGYGRGGMGATLTLLVQGPRAPEVQMALEMLRERVNAVYGFNAISRIHLTQTAATGFAEGQAEYVAKAPGPAASAPTAQAVALASGLTAEIRDSSLREALAQLGQSLLTASDRTKGS